jgi:hypothetical protein
MPLIANVPAYKEFLPSLVIRLLLEEHPYLYYNFLFKHQIINI